MGSLKALLLASVAGLAAMSSASAADLFLPPPPPVEPPAYVPIEFSNGFYLRGDIGAGLPALRGAQSTFQQGGIPGGLQYSGQSINDQALVGIGAGYQFNNFFRADVTGEYRSEARLHATETYTAYCPPSLGTCADMYGGAVHTELLLANGYVDLGTWYRLTPYVGAGIGVAVNTFSAPTDINYSVGGFGAATADKTTTSLAYAGIAGVSYALTPNLKLDVSYRYVDMGRIGSAPIICYNSAGCGLEALHYHVHANDIRFGLRYMFADFVEPPPPPPLVRKY